MVSQPGEMERPTLRRERLKWAWLLALPFLYFAVPSPPLLLTGALLSLLGLLLRASAAGSIHKDRELATGGPYHRLRHPLYVGSFFVGFGLALAGGRWWFLPLFFVLFLWLYSRTIRAEEERLTRHFGEAYEIYRRRVPAFLPRLRASPPAHSSPGFRWELYARNREWQAALGTAAAYGLLWIRSWLPG